MCACFVGILPPGMQLEGIEFASDGVISMIDQVRCNLVTLEGIPAADQLALGMKLVSLSCDLDTIYFVTGDETTDTPTTWLHLHEAMSRKLVFEDRNIENRDNKTSLKRIPSVEAVHGSTIDIIDAAYSDENDKHSNCHIANSGDEVNNKVEIKIKTDNHQVPLQIRQEDMALMFAEINKVNSFQSIIDCNYLQLEVAAEQPQT